MIDVVFLLLVFFMLASRFGANAILPMPLAAGGGAYDGPPRLVDVFPDHIKVNGARVEDLPAALRPLMQSPDNLVILRGQNGAKLQSVVDTTEVLRAAGYTSVVLVE